MTDGQEDYAILVLDRDISSQTGSFGLKTLPMNSLRGIPASLYGYPYQIEDKSNSSDLWGAQGEFEIDEGLIRYEFNTTKGQEGSGVYICIDDRYYIIGIHTPDEEDVDKATFMNSSRIKRIKSWIESNSRIDSKVSDVDISSFQELNSYLETILSELSRKEYYKISYLNLARNNLEDMQIARLSNSKFPNLTHLNLSSNLIRNEGSAALAFGKFYNLKILDLSNNLMGPESAKSLNKGSFKSLTTLLLSHNKIGPEGARLTSNGNFKSSI